MSGRSAFRAARGERDANHGEIVKAYEELYCGVIDTHGLGFGFPDILVHFSGYCAPVEIKTLDGDLSESQKRFIREWKGPKIRVVHTRADVEAHVIEVRRRMARG
jgi:hypothetical protein